MKLKTISYASLAVSLVGLLLAIDGAMGIRTFTYPYTITPWDSAPRSMSLFNIYEGKMASLPLPPGVELLVGVILVAAGASKAFAPSLRRWIGGIGILLALYAIFSHYVNFVNAVSATPWWLQWAVIPPLLLGFFTFTAPFYISIIIAAWLMK